MEDTFDVRWRNHAMEACGEVSRMRREETFADVVLCTDEQVFKVHRVILAACSSYFERIFTRMGDGKYTPFVVLRETDACLLKLVVDFIYDGHVRVPCDKLPGFMALAQGLEVRGLMGIPFEVCVEDGEDEPVPVRAKKRRSRDESPTDVKPMSNKVVNKVAVNNPGQDFGEANGSAGEEEQMVEDYQEFKFEMDEEPFNGEAGDQDFPESAEECGENQEKLENNLEVLESSVDLDQRTFPQPVAIGDIPRNIPPEISPTGLVRLTAYILRGKGPDGLPVSFCAVCGYMSPSAQNAIRHERIHTGERPFQCHLCNRRFSQSSNYRRHLISIHSTSPE